MEKKVGDRKAVPSRKVNGFIKFIWIILIMFLGLFGWAISSQAGNWYVDKDAAGTRTGSSWSNAWTQLCPYDSSTCPGVFVGESEESALAIIFIFRAERLLKFTTLLPLIISLYCNPVKRVPGLPLPPGQNRLIPRATTAQSFLTVMDYMGI